MINRIVIMLGLGLAGLSGGCAQFEFDVVRDGDNQPLHVATSEPSNLAVDPLQYRMQASEGHLVMWIDNPTNDSIELIGGKSSVTDPDGMDHPLHGKTIRPLSSITEILPPLQSQGSQAGPKPPPPVNPYGQPGFIPVPGVGSGNLTQDDSQESPYFWQWDGESEIQLHLVFVQGGRQFVQRFTIRRVKK